MTDPARLLAVATPVALLVIMLIGWWRAERRADRGEAARDTAIGQRDAATAAANQHWRDLRQAQAELARYRRNLSEADHWATVPRETPRSALANPEGASELPEYNPPADSIDRPPFDQPTALLPQYPKSTPEYDAYAAELRAELAKFVALEPPYDRPITATPAAPYRWGAQR